MTVCETPEFREYLREQMADDGRIMRNDEPSRCPYCGEPLEGKAFEVCPHCGLGRAS